MTSRLSLLLRIVATGLVLWLAGCAAPVKAPEPAPPPPRVEPTPANAEQLEAAGEHARAAQVWLDLAAAQPPAQRPALQIRAARALALSGNDPDAEPILLALNPATLAPVPRVERNLLLGEIELRRRNGEQALALFDPTPLVGLREVPRDLFAGVLRGRAAAFGLLGHHFERARALVDLDLVLGEGEARLARQQEIVATLHRLSDAMLAQMQTSATEPLRGWLALARIGRTPIPAEEFKQRLAQWRAQSPAHPALAPLIEEIGERVSLIPVRPRRVALMLSFEGPFAEAASAVREGFLAAYYAEEPETRPELRFYDVGADPSRAPEVYARAAREGADWVVGPLDKAAVAALAGAEITAPVLALNTVESATPVPQRMIQFGLSPEDEARQAAERAWQDGRTRAVALVPAGNWGERVLAAFVARWTELGGVLLEAQTYDPRQNDHSDAITRALDLDESEARRRALGNLLGRELKFEPRRRQDLDAVFLAAQPRNARLLRPQLKFHRASELPVYATSHIYTGVRDRDADRDMDDIAFVDAPWVFDDFRQKPGLHKALYAGSRAPLDPRLHALGIDAYELLPYVEWLRANPTQRVEGETGSLALDARNRIERRLVWARFRAGSAVPTGFANPIEPAPPAGAAPG